MENAVTVEEMCARRELRVRRQHALISAFGLPLVCFTMNIAGPIKLNPLIEWGFNQGLSAIKKDLDVSIVYSETIREKTGCEAVFCVKLTYAEIKQRMVMIEENTSLGRWYDIDVIGTDGTKISRSEPRKCIICGGPATVCARSRVHSVQELQAKTQSVFASALSKKIGQFAFDALYNEVHTTPKPGLVDERNNGAHNDMDIVLFEKSIHVLKPYFSRMAEYAATSEAADCAEMMLGLQQIGREAEEAMLAETNGINTHRGAIYSLGLIASACAIVHSGKTERFLVSCNNDDEIEEIYLGVASALAKAQTCDKNETSNGATIRLKYGVGGAREQAMAGFPLLRLAKSLKKEYDVENNAEGMLSGVDSWVYALLGIMARLDDNNALKRGGEQGAAFVKRTAARLLQKRTGLMLSDLYKFDDELISLNISCGGAADMLGAAMLMEKIEEFSVI